MWRALLLLFAVSAGAAELVWSTFFGGGGLLGDGIQAIAVDRGGHPYVTGWTGAASFPVTAGAVQRTHGGGRSDAFVSKLLPDGSGLAWSSYLGGTGHDQGADIKLDAAGNVYVLGFTESPDFRSTVGERAGCPCWFVVKLNGITGALVYSRIESREQGAVAATMAIDRNGAVFLTGSANQDAFIHKLDERGTFVWQRTFGGSKEEIAASIAITSTGELILTGETDSPDFPTTAGAFQRALAGPWARKDVFVTRLAPDGSSVISSTLLGGEYADYAGTVKVDREGNAYVLGNAPDGGLPWTPPSFEFPGRPHFLAKVTRAGGLEWLHGIGSDAFPLAVSPAGDAYLAGYTLYPNLPVTGDAIQSVRYGIGYDASLFRVDADPQRLSYGTRLGGTANDMPAAVALDDSGHVYLGGQTNSADFPTTPGAFQRRQGGSAFLAKIDLAAMPAVRVQAVVNGASFTGGPLVPGELITLFGDGLGPEAGVSASAAGGFLPTTLAGTQVLVDGAPVPLLYVSRTQINAIVPFAATGLVEIAVSSAAGRSRAIPFQTALHEPGAFRAVLNQDNTPNSASNPARRGEIVQMWVTGAGDTEPALADGSITPLDSRAALRQPVQVRPLYPGQAAEVLYAGAAPGMPAGVAQVNFRVPQEVASGSVEFRLSGASVFTLAVD